MLSINNQAISHFVDITEVDPRITLDIRYATIDNFLGFAVYSKAICYLHRDAAGALKRVQDEIEPLGLFLKVYDGYRPIPVQQLMWDLIQDERYVSNPSKYRGGHTRGTAVDLTLVDSQGHELEMPTTFDEFNERSHSDSLDASWQALQNRSLLKIVMENHGFIQCPSEWWHFDLDGWDDDILYPPLSISFDEIEAHQADFLWNTAKLP